MAPQEVEFDPGLKWYFGAKTDLSIYKCIWKIPKLNPEIQYEILKPSTVYIAKP